MRMMMDSSSSTDIHVNVNVARWRWAVDIREINNNIVSIYDFGLLGIWVFSKLLAELKALAGTYFTDLLALLLLQVILRC